MAIGATLLAVRFRENEQCAVAQQRQLRDIAENLGEVQVEFAPFDWDGRDVSPAVVAALSRSWRLWPVDPANRDQPLLERPLAVQNLHVEGNVATFLAPGGDAFLEVFERGGACASSWVRLLALPGYAERVRAQHASLRLPVPTCAASRQGEIAVRPGLWLDRTEAPNALFGPFETMLPRMGCSAW